MAETLEKKRPVADQLFGDNRPPVDEVLKADFADLVARVQATVERAAEAPAKVKTEDDLGKVGDIILAMKGVAKEADETRAAEGKPLYDAKKELDAFFKGLIAKLDAAGAPLQERADDYTRRKQAEAQERARQEAEKARAKEEEARERAVNAKTPAAAGRAAADVEAYAAQADHAAKTAQGGVKIQTGGVSAGAVGKWAVRIDDYEKVDLNTIKPFLNRDAVEAALRSMVRIQKENFNVPGATAYRETKTRFRK